MKRDYAYKVYRKLYYYVKDQNIDISNLYNISTRSEDYHIRIVRDLVNKYNITDDDITILTQAVSDSSTNQYTLPTDSYGVDSIQELYDKLIDKGLTSQRDALEVGCMVEVTDINDLNEKIVNAQESGAKDLEDGFGILRQGSYNHYWGFDDALKNIGVYDGCCSLGVIDGVSYCHPEYPQR